MQRARDRAAGLNTAGFISGYRGSPLGTYDSALWQAKALLEKQRHPLPARPQRRPRRHRGVGQPAGRPVSRRHGRWRVRHLVRQRPWRRPLARRAAPRQLGGHIAARWRAGHRGRRSRRAKHHHGLSMRTGVRGGDDADPQSGDDPGLSRSRAVRFRAVAVLRMLGGVQGGERSRRQFRVGLRRSAKSRGDDAERFRHAAGRRCISAGRAAAWIGRSSRNAACTAQNSPRPRRFAAPTASTVS